MSVIPAFTLHNWRYNPRYNLSYRLMLAAVKCGAISGMLNYHQRGDVLKHSFGLLNASAVVAETDLLEPISESGAQIDGLITI